ncbi:hypothetical protein TL16_g05303 [Triparma laevis f. inornata]|uniref:Uncharacterized protein n=1 Tax=Triparma laevis f. inornata TaxID=1714386 RepID=A0A9W7ADK3_9STRA|nr:hypothetical protein TL16_g05303 [Triparma laevis f. inornata]
MKVILFFMASACAVHFAAAKPDLRGTRVLSDEDTLVAQERPGHNILKTAVDGATAVTNAAVDAAATAANAYNNVADTATNVAGNVVDTTTTLAGNVANTATTLAGNVADTATTLAGNVMTDMPTMTDVEPIVGNDRDAYGCIPSAGYGWCESLNECTRPWETPCPASIASSTIADTAMEAYNNVAGTAMDAYLPYCGGISECIDLGSSHCLNDEGYGKFQNNYKYNNDSCFVECGGGGGVTPEKVSRFRLLWMH